MEENQNPQREMIPAAPISVVERSRPPTDLYPYPYEVKDNCLYMEQTVKGARIDRKLCNFIAWITEEATRYDGLETMILVKLQGIHASGRALPQITVPLSKLGSFDWLDLWGADCILEVGSSVREHIRKAIQETVIHAQRKTEYAVTGWKKIDGIYEFLMPGDSNLAVNLPSKLGGYFITGQCTDEDMKTLASLMECKLVPPDILYPLVAYVFLSPLIEFLRHAGCIPKFVLFLVGKTGSRKSTLAALMLSFFGRFTATELPLSFRDTANSILYNAFTLKDVPTVIDDFHPADNQEGKKLTATAQSIMRSYGDRQGRGRLKADSTPMESRPPQGNAIITGEYPPDIGQSGTARYLALELKESDMDLKILSRFQKEAAKGTFQNCTYGYLQFLKETFLCNDETVAEFERTLASVFEGRRDIFLKSGVRCHGRVPEMVAHLELSMKILLMFLESRNALSAERCEEISQDFTRVMYRIASRQAENIEQDKPTHIFIRKLYSLIESGQVVIRRRNEYSDYCPPSFVGYEDSNYYYLYKDAAHRTVRRLCEEQGESFSISAVALTKALAEEGFSVRDGSKNTKKLDLGNTAPRMIWLKKDRAQGIVDEVC
ncbi:MAG: hypothetical protein ACI4PO_03610 [Faecousia sp.]